MAARLKLIVAYDGTPFGGWQSQKHGNTIQDYLERAFAAVLCNPVRVHGAGRTDSGVHALAQCAHADVPDRRLSPDRWIAALNGNLPPTIRVLRCSYVSSAFHARHSARGKIYRYLIWNAAVLPPFRHRREWHVVGPLDLAAIRSAARHFVGSHDFAGFAANRGQAVDETVRTLRKVSVTRKGPQIALQFEGDGFLYKMVRMMVGALVRVGQGRLTREQIRGRLTAGRATAAPRLVAPAEGLVLVRVRY